MMIEIEDWVYDANAGDKMTFEVPSLSLQKALSK
jgi:hypothetical protein